MSLDESDHYETQGWIDEQVYQSFTILFDREPNLEDEDDEYLLEEMREHIIDKFM